MVCMLLLRSRKDSYGLHLALVCLLYLVFIFLRVFLLLLFLPTAGRAAEGSRKGFPRSNLLFPSSEKSEPRGAFFFLSLVPLLAEGYNHRLGSSDINIKRGTILPTNALCAFSFPVPPAFFCLFPPAFLFVCFFLLCF